MGDLVNRIKCKYKFWILDHENIFQMPSTNTSFPSPSLTRARLSLPRQDLISVIMIIMFATITIFICSCPKFINSHKYTNSNFHLILNMASWYFNFFWVCKLFVARVLGYMSGNYSCHPDNIHPASVTINILMTTMNVEWIIEYWKKNLITKDSGHKSSCNAFSHSWFLLNEQNIFTHKSFDTCGLLLFTDTVLKTIFWRILNCTSEWWSDHKRCIFMWFGAVTSTSPSQTPACSHLQVDLNSTYLGFSSNCPCVP